MSPQHRRLLAACTLVVVLAAGCGSGGSGKPAPTTRASGSGVTTTTSDTGMSEDGSTSTGGSGGTSTTALPAERQQPKTAIWPFADTGARYQRPDLAVQVFATSYLGFVNPIIGPFQQGDSQSGEATIRSSATGPVTTVLLRKLPPDGYWWVIGASTPNLRLTSPATGATITSPVTLAGQSTAFEATVNVEIRRDGTDAPLASDTVMGGSNGTMGPFSKAITFTKGSAQSGAILLKTLSAKDGAIQEASVIRVHFG